MNVAACRVGRWEECCVVLNIKIMRKYRVFGAAAFFLFPNGSSKRNSAVDAGCPLKAVKPCIYRGLLRLC